MYMYIHSHTHVYKLLYYYSHNICIPFNIYLYRLITCTTKTCGTTTCTCTYMYISVFDKLIWRTFGPKNFLFGTAQFSLWVSGTVDYDYIVTNSIKSSLIGSRCFPMAHTLTIFEPIWPMLQNLSKTLTYIPCILHV